MAAHRPLGDVRVSFRLVHPHCYKWGGQNNGNTFPYNAVSSTAAQTVASDTIIKLSQRLSNNEN